MTGTHSEGKFQKGEASEEDLQRKRTTPLDKDKTLKEADVKKTLGEGVANWGGGASEQKLQALQRKDRTSLKGFYEKIQSKKIALWGKFG